MADDAYGARPTISTRSPFHKNAPPPRAVFFCAHHYLSLFAFRFTWFIGLFAYDVTGQMWLTFLLFFFPAFVSFADIATIVQFALHEFRYGEPQRGQTMFESILTNYPKRSDLWSVYLDMMVKQGDAEPVRWGINPQIQFYE